MQKFSFITKTLIAFTVGLGFTAVVPAAQATSLVPQQEGEIQLTNIACLGSGVPCIDTTSYGYTVKSLAYDNDGLNPQYGLSRLFVDNRNSSNNWGFGITFGTTDAGTNPPPGEYWFRPVAYQIDGVNEIPAENGQLEVGKFLFDFGQEIISELTLDFFDTEDANFTGILAINGTEIDPKQYVPSGSNGNKKKITLTNVSSFEVQLGKPGPNSVFPNTGDGVALQASAKVPEPGITLGLSALTLVGMFNLRQRKKAAKAV